ncbi:MAG: Asp23/Gls24 family envelope stress response protein [Ruminococcus sp.]|nr:Asp23/Gls24 family envelope stress response protein [Ruminococcus sp.]
MIKVKNHLGTIGITDKYIKTLVSKTAQSCFGVADINHAGAVQGITDYIKRRRAENFGVTIKHTAGGRPIIGLHISVAYGVNVNAIAGSIIHKVEYVMESEAGIKPEKVNVFIDKMVG